MREIRTLRATWRGLETWHGRDTSAYRRASSRPYHVLPEGLRILAVEGRKRNDLLHAVDAVAENDGAMKIVAFGR